MGSHTARCCQHDRVVAFEQREDITDVASMAWKSLPHHRAVSRRWRGAHTVRAGRTTHSCRIRSPRASPDEQAPRPSRTPRRLSARRRGVASVRRLAGDAVLDLSGDDVSERRAGGGALHAFPTTASLYFFSAWYCSALPPRVFSCTSACRRVSRGRAVRRCSMSFCGDRMRRVVGQWGGAGGAVREDRLAVLSRTLPAIMGSLRNASFVRR